MCSSIEKLEYKIEKLKDVQHDTDKVIDQLNMNIHSLYEKIALDEDKQVICLAKEFIYDVILHELEDIYKDDEKFSKEYIIHILSSCYSTPNNITKKNEIMKYIYDIASKNFNLTKREYVLLGTINASFVETLLTVEELRNKLFIIYNKEGRDDIKEVAHILYLIYEKELLKTKVKK